MASHQQGRQKRKYPRSRFIFAGIVIALVILAAAIWIRFSQGSWPTILSVVFIGGALIISLLQWLFPVFHAPIEPAILDKQNTLPDTAEVAQVDNTADRRLIAATVQPALADLQDPGLTQSQHTIKCNHIAAPPGTVFDKVETLTEIQRCLTDKDIRGLFLWGGRGCGKSLIAKKIAEDCMVEDGLLGKRFTHIVWLTFRKEELTTSGIWKPYNYHQSKHEIYAEILKVHEQPYLGNKDPLRGVQEVLRKAPTLVILDSFESFLEEKEELDGDVAALLSEVAVGSFFLLTSWRDSAEIRRYTYRVIKVEPFDATFAKEFFLYRCKEKSILLPLEQWKEGVDEEIFKATAGIPLALELVGSYLYSIGDVEAALTDIKSRDHYLWEYLYKKSLQQLQKDELRLLVMMILFKSPPDKRRLREATRFDVLRYERALTRLRYQGLFEINHDNFYLHDTLREYIMSRVEHSVLMTEVQQDFIDWAIRIVRANTNWEVDSKQANAFANDLNNLIAALEIMLSRKTFEENTLCVFGTTVAHYLHVSGRWTESEKFLKALLSKMTEDGCKIKVQVLLGRHYAHQEKIGMAVKYLRPAAKKAEDIGDETLQAEVYLRLGQTFLRSDPQLALRYLEKARDKAARNSNYDSLRTRISALSYMAEIQILDHKSKEALELLEEADKGLTKLGLDHRVRAHHARLKADAYLLLGRKAMARKFYNESKNLSENVADGRLLAWNFLGLAVLDRNVEYARKAKELFETVGLKSQVKRAEEIIDKLTST